jgi:hypothetical protein
MSRQLLSMACGIMTQKSLLDEGHEWLADFSIHL